MFWRHGRRGRVTARAQPCDIQARQRAGHCEAPEWGPLQHDDVHVREDDGDFVEAEDVQPQQSLSTPEIPPRAVI